MQAAEYKVTVTEKSASQAEWLTRTPSVCVILTTIGQNYK